MFQNITYLINLAIIIIPIPPINPVVNLSVLLLSLKPKS